MACMRLLVHIAGEADLLLNAQKGCRSDRARRIATRCSKLSVALAGPSGVDVALDMLIKGAWNDELLSTAAPSPLFGALDTLEKVPDLEVLVLGTRQDPRDPLDTLPIAQSIAEVLNRLAAEDESCLARRATALLVPGLDEEAVVKALSRHLGDSPQYRQVLVTWGSGSTAMAMGALTALSVAGLTWRLVRTSGSDLYDIVDPLDNLDADPIASVFIRWRMFAALEDAVRENPPTVRLTDTQRELVRQAAARHRAGLEARDNASLRALVADAVVRRDGTASLTVRRYVTSQYEELLATDQATHPWAVDLLRKYEYSKDGRPLTLGQKLCKIEKDTCADSLPSCKWLFGREVKSLLAIGNGSHTLQIPDSGHAKIIGEHLSGFNIDGTGWRESGLPEPPIAPADVALVVWLAGITNSEVGTVGEQLNRHGLPAEVQNYLDVEKAWIRAVIFGVEGEGGSRHYAAADAERIRAVTHGSAGESKSEAWDVPMELVPVDQTAVEMAIEKRITRDTAALLFIPTGSKPALLAMLRAMRRIGARHGLPLFVRQTANPSEPGVYSVHLWPGLTGGDLPLLKAAQKALSALELDVAWRLLAASAIDPEITQKGRWLATAFASRQPLRATQWPQPDLAPTADLDGRTTGMIVQRLALVYESLTCAMTSADRIRLLVLAADVVEASIAATQKRGRPGAKYGEYRKRWDDLARRCDTPMAGPARILLMLNGARDAAPITHGTLIDPDELVADVASRLDGVWRLRPAEAAELPRDVETLLSSAVNAAAAQGLGLIDQRDNLRRLRDEIAVGIDTAIRRRTGTGR